MYFTSSVNTLQNIHSRKDYNFSGFPSLASNGRSGKYATLNNLNIPHYLNTLEDLNCFNSRILAIAPLTEDGVVIRKSLVVA